VVPWLPVRREAGRPGEDKQPYRPGRTDLAVGPLLIPNLRGWAHARPDSYGHDHQFKVGVQVRRGQTATLVIPAAFKRVAGLLYAEQARLAQTPAEADHAVTFSACADHHTPWWVASSSSNPGACRWRSTRGWAAGP
jgi:hypothetical protein